MIAVFTSFISAFVAMDGFDENSAFVKIVFEFAGCLLLCIKV